MEYRCDGVFQEFEFLTIRDSLTKAAEPSVVQFSLVFTKRDHVS